MAFNIGDQVRIKRYDEIPQAAKSKKIGSNPHLWNCGKARLCGMVGRVVDKLYSEAYDCNVYRVHFDGMDKPSYTSFVDDNMEPFKEGRPEVSFETKISGDTVIVEMYRKSGANKDLVSSGHGYIYSEGLEGIAQAAAYALKMIWCRTNWHEDAKEEEE